MGTLLPDDRANFVQTLYLDMMSLNALEHGADLLPTIAEKGAMFDAAAVIELLRDPWRSTVMGAWLALLHDERDVTEAVLAALEASAGSLTSPPLTVAAVVLAGRGALPSLAVYAAADAANRWGACGFAAAAADHLGGSVACEPSDSDRAHFEDLLALAQRLRSAQ